MESGVPRDDPVEALRVEVVGRSGEVWQVVNVYIPPPSEYSECDRQAGED